MPVSPGLPIWTTGVWGSVWQTGVWRSAVSSSSPTIQLQLGLGGSFRRTLLDSDGLVAAWPLAELSSIASVRNIVARGSYDGFVDGTGDFNLGYPVDIPEGALGFRVASGAGVVYVEVPHASALCLAGGKMDITFLLVTSTNDATNRCIVQKQDTNSTGNGWHVSMQNGAIEFYLKVGGSVVFNFQRGSIADGQVHLIRCCYDPTGTSTARIMIDGVQSGATVTAVSTLPGSTTAALRIGAFSDGAVPFVGVVSHVAIGTSGDHTVAATLLPTLSWTDVTSSVRESERVQVDYGIRGTSPRDRVALPGTIQFALNNRNPSTGALGYYSIGHANVRSGFDLRIPVRLAITYNSTTSFKFRGSIQSVTPTTGQNRSLDVLVTATDWLQIATDTNIVGLEGQVNQGAFQCFGFVVDQADTPPVSTQVNSNTGSFPYAFDNSESESMSAMTEFQRIADSDQIHIYIKADTTTGGVLVCESRATRQAKTYAASFDDSSITDLAIAHDVDSMVNRCKVTVSPRTDGTANQVLWAMGEPRLLPAKVNTVIEGPYTDPAQNGRRCGGQNLQTLSSGTDYAQFQFSDSTGRDMTSSLQIVDESGGNGARFRVHNADDQDGYLTIMQKRGQALYDVDPSTEVHEDADSIRKYGARQVSFGMPYQTDCTVAKNAAILTVNSRKSPLSNVREMRFMANASATLLTQAILREPGDVIRIREQVATGSVYVAYYINAVSLEIAEGNLIWCSWTLAPVNAYGGFWILGTSTLGTDTVLGWTD